MINFVALKTFYSPEFRSEYCQGLNYSLPMSDLMCRWIEAGMIEPRDYRPKISGIGEVLWR